MLVIVLIIVFLMLIGYGEIILNMIYEFIYGFFYILYLSLYYLITKIAPVILIIYGLCVIIFQIIKN